MRNSTRCAYGSRSPSPTCRSPFASPIFDTRVAPRRISKCWMANVRSSPPSSHLPRRAATSIRAWCNFTDRSEAAGNSSRRKLISTHKRFRSARRINLAQTAGSSLVEMMIKSGVRNIYGIVGDSANPIIDAIRASDGKLKFINVRNEEAGAFAAGADSQVSGRPTAVIVSSGPGSLHLLNGLYDCARNGASVFAIATHVPTTEIGTNYFQETRPEQIFLDCTKYMGYVTSAAQMPRIAELAMQAAILERGVGMIILPGDVSAAPIEHPMLEHPIATERSRVRPPDRDLDRVADLIAKSERIAIFGGAGCIDARAEVLQLSQLLNAPVGFTFRGKDILEAANPNAVGMTGLLGWGGAYAAIGECDLLLMLGTDFPYHPFMPEKSTIVQIDEQAGHLGRRAKVNLGLVGDVGETLKALLPLLTRRTDRKFLDKILLIHQKAGDDLQTYVTHKGSG